MHHQLASIDVRTLVEVTGGARCQQVGKRGPGPGDWEAFGKRADGSYGAIVYSGTRQGCREALGGK
jgi:hypothetical protein